ncbi:unnamed protein product [Vitrella brassicaformis CCMP3155]|uniref:HTH CENPB-type domain-containing protein n=1 Tax=Vitrella brassicaformis (strain CCMP3155) TaxID=1169540 RepID=A0A0G4GMF4_VITBC|nr:unnamed protein product [Vitrella brassicaformis CCMP3155]|eukprot:CEM31388.1 unnamed protein product [Vitrella brassicaformis CCMP3155]
MASQSPSRGEEGVQQQEPSRAAGLCAVQPTSASSQLRSNHDAALPEPPRISGGTPVTEDMIQTAVATIAVTGVPLSSNAPGHNTSQGSLHHFSSTGPSSIDHDPPFPYPQPPAAALPHPSQPPIHPYYLLPHHALVHCPVDGVPAVSPDATAGSARRRASSLPYSSRSREFTIDERERLVDEFETRRAAGEALTQQAFALEKGITLSQLKHWLVKVGQETEAADKTKKRNRPPRYGPIEAEMRQWMLTQQQPMQVPCEAIRRRALEIARRLGINDFKASNSWITGLKERYQQGITFVPELSPAASVAAAAAAPDTDDVMVREDYMKGALTSDLRVV